jgi:hypothetical protein
LDSAGEDIGCADLDADRKSFDWIVQNFFVNVLA